MDWNNINRDRDTSGLGPIEYDQTKVPALIRKHADNVRGKSYGQEIREAQARNAEYAGLIASEAVDISNETKERQDTVETQFNSVQQELTDKDVISAPEIIAARNGEATLVNRLDKEYQYISDKMSGIALQVSSFGAIGDGVTDDTVAIRNAINLVSASGGVLVFEKNKEYLVSSDLYFKDNKYVTVEGNNATLIRKETTTQYSVIYYSGDITFNNLHIVGHINWNNDTDRFPIQSFGFRVMKFSKGKSVFNNCTVRNIGYDGFYHDGENASLELNNCQSFDCYRCGVAVVGGSYIKIDGGVYGANTLEDITESVAAIDIEPSKSANIQHVEIINCEVPNLITIYDGETNRTTIQYVYLDNITFNDTVPSVKHGLSITAAIETVIGRMIFNGASGYYSMNTLDRPGSITRGSLIRFMKEDKRSSNLVNTDNFELRGYAENITEVVFNDIKGYHFNNRTSGTYATYRQTIPVKKNTFYTLSAYMELTNLIGAGNGVVINVGDDVFTLQSDRNRKSAYSNLLFNTGEVEAVELVLGTGSSSIIDVKIGDVRLHEGFVNI